MKHFFTTLFFLSLAVTSQGQGFHNVEAVGECEKKPGIDAESVALSRAKDVAMSQVLGKTVSTAIIYRTRNDEEEFYRNTHVQETGVVFVQDKQVEETKKKVTVTILANVYSAEMPKTFDVQMVCQNPGYSDESVRKRQYTEDIPLAFQVNSYTNNFINAFWFDEETGNGGLLFTSVLFEGRERTFNDEYTRWDKIFPELMTKEQRERLYFRDMQNYIPPKPRVGGTKHLKIVFIATPDPLAPPTQVTDELSFEKWWTEIPRNQRQQPVIEHLTFLM